MILAATVLYIPDFIWLQILMTIYLTQFAAIYLVHYKPFEDPTVQRLEVFNELTTMLLLSIVYCFTPLVPEKRHEMIGKLYMTVVGANICAHFFFLIKNFFKHMRQALLKCQRRQKQKE